MKKNQLSVFLILGFVFLVVGLANKQVTFGIIGLAFMIVGFSSLVNKKKDADDWFITNRGWLLLYLKSLERLSF